MEFDVCVIGHVTRDLVRVAGRAVWSGPGGSAYYTAAALCALGMRVAVVTRLARADAADLLKDLESRGAEIFARFGSATTHFENSYPAAGAAERAQRVRALAPPIAAGDLPAITAAFYHLGPLTRADLAPDLAEALARRPALISADMQGWLRTLGGERVTLGFWPDARVWLRHVAVLKANEEEACSLTGCAEMAAAASRLAEMGPRELLLTRGAAGSLVAAEGRLHAVPAFPPRRLRDVTGAGDSYVAGYLCGRLRGLGPPMAGRLGAAVATAKIAHVGPFGGRLADACAMAGLPVLAS